MASTWGAGRGGSRKSQEAIALVFIKGINVITLRGQKFLFPPPSPLCLLHSPLLSFMNEEGKTVIEKFNQLWIPLSE